jgi:hypothetical protein
MYKKIIIILLILVAFMSLRAEDFDEYSFMKKVNPNITMRTMRIIKESIDKNFHMVSDVFTKKDIYLTVANESHFKQNAVNKYENGSSDRGLFQVNKPTYYSLVKFGIVKNEWSKMFTVKYNVKVGLIILKRKKERVVKKLNPHKDDVLYMTLIAYNKGLGNLILDLNDGRTDFHNYKYIKSINRFKKHI